MTSRAARFDAERRRAEISLVVIQTLKELGLLNTMLSTRECIRRYGVWFRMAVKDGRLVGVKCGNTTRYSVEDILSLRSLELERAKELSEDYII